jgi:hypothetical protein
MADKTVTQLTELTAVDDADILLIVDDPAGTPVSKKCTVANALKATNALSANTSVAATDELLLIDDPAGTLAAQKCTVAELLKVINTLTANSTVALTDILPLIDDPSGTPAAQKATVADVLSKIWVGVPANAGATGTAGQLAYASGYLYVCVAANTWQRVAIATW